MDASLFKPLALSLRNHLENTPHLQTKKGHDSAREMLLPFVSLLCAFWETFNFFFPAFPFGVEAAGYLHENTLKLCKEGVGGTYFVPDSTGATFAIWKPVDEEPGAENNPKKLMTHPLLPPGGGAAREVVAYALDLGWAGVPETYLLENIQTRTGLKTGSVQRYISNNGFSSSVGSSSFLVDDVHRIGVLDLRLFNMDRNGENMLIKKDDHLRLVPIDHTYILPETLDGAYFDWMYWNQAKKPFSQDILNYIQSIDLERDVTILLAYGLSTKSIRTLLLSTLLLKHCASIGKNLFEIATLVCRDISQAPSRLEELVAMIPETDDLVGFCNAFVALLEKFIM